MKKNCLSILLLILFTAAISAQNKQPDKLNKNGQDWYLIKDAGDPAFDGRYKGYFFFSSDYVKLKMLVAMVHKNAVENLLNKFDK